MTIGQLNTFLKKHNSRNQLPLFVFITGASGARKTLLAKTLEQRYKKYLKIEGQSTVVLNVLNEEKLKCDQKWDGLHGVITNAEDIDAAEILNYYRGLWQIEETFSFAKSDLKIRPIFHWTPDRVRAHIAMCYMALCCVRSLEYRVERQHKKLSPEVIRDNLLSVQASLLIHKPTGRKYLMPSSTKEHTSTLYKTMGLKLSTQPILL